VNEILCIGGPHDGRRVHDFGQYYRCHMEKPKGFLGFETGYYRKESIGLREEKTRIDFFVFQDMKPLEAFQRLIEHYHPPEQKHE
jgi:hypothetical protein